MADETGCKGPQIAHCVVLPPSSFRGTFVQPFGEGNNVPHLVSEVIHRGQGGACAHTETAWVRANACVLPGQRLIGIIPRLPGTFGKAPAAAALWSCCIPPDIS